MKSYTLLLFSCLLFATCTTKNSGEPNELGFYVKLLGGSKDDVVNDAFLNEQGEVIGTGTTKSFVNAGETVNMFIFKTDRFGNKIWQKNFTGLEGNYITPASDGSYLVLGTEPAIPSVNKRIRFWKIGADGTLQNEKLITADKHITGLSIGILPTTPTEADYILLGGWQQISNIGFIEQTKNYFARIDKNGILKYDKKYFTEGYDFNTPQVMRTQPNGESIVAGLVNGQARLIAIDADLGVKWDFFYNSDEADSNSAFTDIQVTGNGYLCVGNTIASSTHSMPFIVKTGFIGELMWKKNIKQDNSIVVNSINLAQDGGYILTGTVTIKTTENTHTDIWVGKLNSTGDLEWQKNFGGKRNDVGKTVRTTQNGDYVILGNITFETNQMIALIRMDKNGNLIQP